MRLKKRDFLCNGRKNSVTVQAKALRVALFLLLLLPIGLMYAGEVTSTDSEDCWRPDVFSSPPRIVVPDVSDVTRGGSWGDNVEEPHLSGSEYQISKPQHLAWIAKQTNDGSKTFSGNTIKLMKDIDLSANKWVPIGNNARAFEGSIDGGGHRIFGLSVRMTEGNIRAGLVGVLKSGTSSVSIKNLHIADASVAAVGSVGRAGIMVGTVILAGNDVTIEECSIGGIVENSSKGAQAASSEL